METCDMNLLKKNKFTKYYIQLIHNLNSKIDSKIENLSNKIIDEFEKKKIELLKMKEELDELHKTKNEINNINAFYELTSKKDSKSITQTIPFIPLENPYKTGKNILTELSNYTITIQNGELIKKCFKTNSLEICKPDDLKNSDLILSNYSRLILKKSNNIKPLDNNKVLLDSKKLSIIFDFNENKVCLNNAFGRYYFHPNENKFSFSYINSISGSNDGENWEQISNINMNELKSFEKLSIFKWNLLGKKMNETFYRYIALEVSPFKDIVNANQINKYINKLHIPLSGIELYGDYYSDIGKNILNNLDENFEDFFNTYLRVNHLELSSKIESQFLIKMILDSFKEMNNILTNTKSQLLVQQILNSNNSLKIETPNEIENMKEELLDETLKKDISEKEMKNEIDVLKNLNEELENECMQECIQLTNNSTIKNIINGDELDVIGDTNLLDDLSVEIAKEIQIMPNKSKNNKKRK